MYLRAITIGVFVWLGPLATAAAEPNAAPLCGQAEVVAFNTWRQLAAVDLVSRLDPTSENLSLKMRDDVVLDGFRMPHAPTAKPRGALLIVQGNGTPIWQIDQAFKPYAAVGYDVYGFDYRGFRRSKGTASATAILGDYQEILTYLGARYPRIDVYGYSFGGVIASNLTPPPQVGWVVVDSAVGRLAAVGFPCPAAYDPIERLKVNGAKTAYVFGGRDPNYSRGYAKELRDAADAEKRPVIFDASWSHPTQSGSKQDSRRNAAIIGFLTR